MSYASSAQFWFNNTAATSNTTLWYPGAPVATYGYPPLPSVADSQGDYDPMRDAKLAPVEWLRKQIDDVCLLATAA